MISIIYPSRGRPDQAAKAADNFTEQMKSKDYEFILSIDEDDPELKAYHECFPDDRIIISENHNVVEAANNGAKYSSGEILILISDDFVAFPGWDEVVEQSFEQSNRGLLKTFDTTQYWIVTLPIMTRDYYKKRGFIYNPNYEHMFCDTEQTHYADITKNLWIDNKIVFPHEHYSKTKAKKDAVNIKADGTWERGERQYLKDIRQWQSEGLNVFDLSPEADHAGHTNWLKKKLK